MQDHELIALYFARDEQAIVQTDETYGRYCRSIASRIVQNVQDVSECVSDAYLVAWNSIPPKHPENFRTYIGKLTRNSSINRYKHDQAKKRGGDRVSIALEELSDCVSHDDTVEALFDKTVLADAIGAFLRKQDHLRRVLFIRRYFYLDSVSELAALYRMPKNTVASHLYRMRQDLKTYLEAEGIVV